jgi:hypothetical protein
MLLKNKNFVDIFFKMYYNPITVKVKKWLEGHFYPLTFFICSYNNYINIDGNKQS